MRTHRSIDLGLMLMLIGVLIVTCLGMVHDYQTRAAASHQHAATQHN